MTRPAAIDAADQLIAQAAGTIGHAWQALDDILHDEPLPSGAKARLRRLRNKLHDDSRQIDAGWKAWGEDVGGEPRRLDL